MIEGLRTFGLLVIEIPENILIYRTFFPSLDHPTVFIPIYKTLDRLELALKWRC